MYTNYDELARQRMAEHEGYARRRQLQRLAREARRGRAAHPGAGGGAWVLAHRRLVAMPAAAAFAATAILVLVR